MKPKLREHSCRLGIDYDQKVILCAPEEGNDYVVLTTAALYAWHAYNLTTSRGIHEWKLMEVAGFAREDMVLKMLQGYKIIFVGCKEIFVYGFILAENQGDSIFGFTKNSVHKIKGSPWLRRKTVFISHANPDKEKVRDLVRQIEKFTNVWIDERDIRAGDSITEQIDNGLSTCDAIVLCLSNSSINSGWVRKEYAYGMHNGVRVIPLRLESCKPPPILADTCYLNYFDDEDACVEALFEAIEVSTRADEYGT